jgi:hypothetical protein
MRLAWILLVVATVTLSGAAPAKKLPKTDKLWTHPEVASFGLERIAVLPAATFDHNPDVAKQVEVSFAQVFHELPYRWISPGSSREVLRARAGGRDSLLNLMRSSMLATGRVDSLLARDLCGMLRCDAVLSLRVDQWDRQELEWNQAGKPSTTVRITAALVDTLGRLAWSASGLERGEGSTNDPHGNVSGVTSSGLDTKPIKAEAGAPTFHEVMLPLFTRWFEYFPVPAAKPAG